MRLLTVLMLIVGAVPWRRTARRSLCVVTSINPALAVLYNDYDAHRIDTNRMFRQLSPTSPTQPSTALPKWLFSVGMRPRVMFTIGTVLRALQLTTPLKWVFDPSSGIAAGINLLCLWSGSKWPATIILGWVASPPFWRALGTDGPTAQPIPIFHANTLPVNLTHPVGSEGETRPLQVELATNLFGRSAKAVQKDAT